MTNMTNDEWIKDTEQKHRAKLQADKQAGARAASLFGRIEREVEDLISKYRLHVADLGSFETHHGPNTVAFSIGNRRRFSLTLLPESIEAKYDFDDRNDRRKIPPRQFAFGRSTTDSRLSQDMSAEDVARQIVQPILFPQLGNAR